MISARPQSAGLRDVYVVWVLFALTAVAVFATYWRIPPRELWKVHNTGFVGGAGRALVFLSFSAALAAVGILPIVVDRLDDKLADLIAIVALLLCATVALPGVQTESHLDPKWANLPAVIGVYVMIVNPDYLGRMTGDPAGRIALYVSGGLQVFGSLVLWRMVRSV